MEGFPQIVICPYPKKEENISIETSSKLTDSVTSFRLGSLMSSSSAFSHLPSMYAFVVVNGSKWR